MNVYDKNQDILNNSIKEFLNEALYLNIKYELNSLIKENNNLNENNINNIKKILELIKQPQQLLNINFNIRFSFCKSPNINDDIFKPILSNKKLINNILQSIDNNTQIYNTLKDQIKIYCKSQNSFCQQLVEIFKSENISLEYLDELPICFNEKLEKYEVKSNHLAYNMVSYDPVQYKYTKKNKSGNSNGTVVNNVYFKYDKGGQLLKPAKEFAIYQLYKDLFPLSSSTFVSPTQLIVLDNLKILYEDSPIFKKLGSLKDRYNQQDIKIILEYEPDFQKELINALEKYQPFFIQSSLFIKGQTFEKILEDNQNFNFEQIDMESYSTHTIASLLVIHSDYKADNLILEDGTNRIIGIDNDECLCDIEIKGIYTQIRNILFTFKTLMDKPIHQSVRNQFIKHDPYIFIFKWLLQLESKQIEYEQLIQTIYEFKIFNDENEKKTILKNKKNELNLPLIFRKNWISSMCQRFKKIKRILKYAESINHQELFQSIHPLSQSYYNNLINNNNNPLKIIKNIYLSPINDYLIDKNISFIEEEYQPNIKESILELIKSKIYDENEDLNFLIDWLMLIFNYLKLNQINYFQFHKSWYLNNIGIFFKILNFNFSKDLLESVISKFNITDINRVFTYIIKNQSNPNVYNNIEFLINKFEINLKEFENKESIIEAKSLLDMAINFKPNGNFKLFLAFLKHGSNKSIDEKKFIYFYQSLSHEEKLELKPYLLKLFNINNKINWYTSINQLFPIIHDKSRQNNNLKTLETIKGYKRIISDKYWDQLFSTNGKPKKNNIYGTRSVVFIEDEYGNGIYVKFYPQLPGTEIAINKLSELLFGFLTPICEIASIGNIPILLIQQIPGDTLFDALQKDQDIINKIEPSNLSKQLVFAMISNNGDGNLANFIVVKNIYENESYNIYSIDNDQSFMPPVSKPNQNKNQLQVSTVLLLFKQMNDKVHQDVINIFNNLDVYHLLNRWLDHLNYNEIKSLKEKINYKNKETIIGVSFHQGMISELYSKLQRLKQILNKTKSSSPITHLNILEIIEPLVNDRYKPIIFSNLSIVDKYKKLINILSLSNNQITFSNHPTILLLESRSIPCSSIIRNQASGEYGITKALEELELLKCQLFILKELIEKKNHNRISKYHLECLLKSNFNEIKEKKELNKIYELIILKEPSIIYLRNKNNLNINTIKSFKLDSIVKLEILECNNLDTLEGITSKLFFKCLVKLKIIRCDILKTIRIDAPKLKMLEVSNCKQIKTLEIESPFIDYLNLKGSISKNIDLSKFLEKFKNLEYLNISETDYETISITLKFLKGLKVSLMENLTTIFLETPSIETINYEGCHNLNEVNPIFIYYTNLLKIFPKQYLNGNLLSDLKTSKSKSSQVKDLIIGDFKYNITDLSKFRNTILLKRFQIKDKYIDNREQKTLKDIFSLESIEKEVEYIEFWDLYNNKLVPGIIPISIENLYLGKIEFPLLIGYIPSNIKKLELSDEFNQILNPGVIPESVCKLCLGNYQHVLSPGIIPSSVQSLTFGDWFNKPISPGIIPSNVQSLTFGEYFNQPLSSGTIPSSLKSLTFGYFFNQPLSPGTIPLGVESLIFGYRFNQPLSPGIIPSNVQSLTFGDYFNQPLSPGTIPSNVKSLKFGYWFNQPLSSGAIPSSVQSLTFGDMFNQTLSPGIIPSNARSLTFGYYFNQPLSHGKIPSSLRTIIFGEHFNQPLLPGTIPSGIKSITFGFWYDQPLSPGTIPSSVESLTFGFYFNQPLLPGTIPSSVQSLTFGHRFNQPLSPSTIPSSVQILKIGNNIISLNNIEENIN